MQFVPEIHAKQREFNHSFTTLDADMGWVLHLTSRKASLQKAILHE
jgi:hypothetical protein